MTDAAAGVNAQAWRGPSALADQVGKAAQQWDSAGGTRRLWDKDASLWTGADEARWLGWLGAIDAGRALLPALQDIAAGVRRDGFTHALLLGMGGSSLCPEVLARTFGRQPGAPELHVLDSTVPSQVAALEGRVDLDRTLVIVASKSGQHARAERLPAVLLRPRRRRPRTGGGGAPLRRHHRSRVQARRPGQGRRLPAHRLRRADHRRALLGALAVRAGAGRGDGRRRRRLPRRDGADGRRDPVGAGREQPRRLARAAARHRGGRRPRQAHAHRLARHRGPGRLARAAGRRVDGQERAVDRAGRSRGAGAARSLRRRSRLRLPAARHRARRGAGCRRRRARSGRRGRRAHRRGPPARHRPGVLPLGDRHRRRVARHAPQSVRSAGRRGEQDRDEGAHQRLRARWQPAGGDAGRERRRARDLRRREDDASGWPRPPAPARPRGGCARISPR